MNLSNCAKSKQGRENPPKISHHVPVLSPYPHSPTSCHVAPSNPILVFSLLFPELYNHYPLLEKEKQWKFNFHTTLATYQGRNRHLSEKD